MKVFDIIYSENVENKIHEIKEAISRWPVSISYEDVLKWMLQFEHEDFDLALRIVKNLNVLGFDDVNEAVTIAFSKLNQAAIKITRGFYPMRDHYYHSPNI